MWKMERRLRFPFYTGMTVGSRYHCVYFFVSRLLSGGSRILLMIPNMLALFSLSATMEKSNLSNRTVWPIQETLVSTTSLGSLIHHNLKYFSNTLGLFRTEYVL